MSTSPSAASSAASVPSPSTPALTAAANSWGAAALVAPASLTYDPNGFYCNATNTKGHGEKIAGRIPPELYAQVQVLIHCGAFPDYEQPMDVIRDAIVHHLHKRQDQIGTPGLREAVDALIRRLSFKEYLEQVRRDVQEWSTMQETMHETLVMLERDEAWAHIWDFLQRSEDMADPIAEPYRSAILKMINEWRQKVPEVHRPQ